MSSQIVFLFDLDQCLPLEQGLDNDNLELLIANVKDVCLKILCASSHLNGPNAEMQNLAHFSFRFYSSTEYFMVPDQHADAKFQELNEDQFDSLENALSDRFEALLQTSKTNSFNSSALQQHISSFSHKPQYLTLQKALEEVAILYNWDRPLMHSPVKINGKLNAPLNAVYVFTRLPDNNEELCHFMGKTDGSKRRFNHKDIYDRIFNGRNRSMSNIFKGDAQINVNIVDTSSYRQRLPDQTANPEDYGTVKNDFRKCLFQLHGTVIPVDAFTSKNCSKNFQNPHPTCSMLTNYSSTDNLSNERGKSRHVFLEIDSANNEVLKVTSNEQMEQQQGGSSPTNYFKLLTFVKPNPNLVSNPDYENQVFLWPNNESTLAKKPMIKLTHYMISQNYNAIFKCSATGRYALLTALEESLLLLKIMGPKLSDLVGLMMVDSPTSNRFPWASVDLESIFREKMAVNHCSNLPPQDSKSGLSYFRGGLVESSALPESEPFCGIINRVKKSSKQRSNDSEMLMTLKKSYLPKHIVSTADENQKSIKIRRKTSEESVSSNKSGNNSNKSRSRGAELLRLGSKNAELRRNSHEGDLIKENSTSSNPAATNNTTNRSKDESAKELWCKKFMAKLNNLAIPVIAGPEGDNSSRGQLLLAELVKLQLEMLDHGENVALVALAETVITVVLDHVKKTRESTLEEMVMTNFLIDPTVVTKRKPNLAVRIRDYKLQVLFRLELHWLLARQDDQKKIEEEMLVHLRQISIWDSPNQMLTFLQEIIAPFYIDRQPELLYFLYSELDQPPPAGLSALFSPFKGSLSPLDGDPTSSIKSDASYNMSVLPSNNMSNPSSWRVKSQDDGTSQALKERMRKVMLRPQNSMQIDLRDKKQKQQQLPIKKSVKTGKAKTPKRRGAAVGTGNGNKTPTNRKTPVKRRSQGVRRNLSFDDGGGGGASVFSPSKKRLKPTTCTPKKGSKTPKKTPKKQKHSAKTPCKLTPGKQHHIFVPETPTGKNGRRKSDGTQVVKESPNIDALKRENGRTLTASLLVRSRSSFYSGEVSRNLVAVEEQINVRHLQNFNTSLPLNDQKNRQINASQMLFPFIGTRQRTRSTSSQSSTTPRKQDPSAQSGQIPALDAPEDPEVTLNSPFKIPTKAAVRSLLFSPAKNEDREVGVKTTTTPKKRQYSSNYSPAKNNSGATSPSPRKRSRLSSRDFSALGKNDSEIKSPSKDKHAPAPAKKGNVVNGIIANTTPRKQQSPETKTKLPKTRKGSAVANTTPRKRQSSSSSALAKDTIVAEVITPRKTRLSSFLDSPVKNFVTGNGNKTPTNRKKKPSTSSNDSFHSPPVENQFDLLVAQTTSNTALDENRLLLTPTPRTYSKTAPETPQSNNKAKGGGIAQIVLTPIKKAALSYLDSPAKNVAGNENRTPNRKRKISFPGQGGDVGTALGTPDSSSRRSSHRKKKFVEKLGIDDVKLCDNGNIEQSPRIIRTRLQPVPDQKSIVFTEDAKSLPIKSPKKLEIDDLDHIASLIASSPPPPPELLCKTPEASRIKPELEMQTPDTPSPSRPHRRRKFVEKMGIDDVKLSSVLSPKVCITPISKHKRHYNDAPNQSPKSPYMKVMEKCRDKLSDLIAPINSKTAGEEEKPATIKSRNSGISGTGNQPSCEQRRSSRNSSSDVTGNQSSENRRSRKSAIIGTKNESNSEDRKVSTRYSAVSDTGNQTVEDRRVSSRNPVAIETGDQTTELHRRVSRNSNVTKTGSQSGDERRVSISHPTEVPVITDMPKKRKRTETDVSRRDTATIIDPATTSYKTPVKTQPDEEKLFKYDVQVIGDFKLKINRTPTNTPRTLTSLQPVQRISRRASMQLGITPENLLQLQTRSPSPMKKFAPTPIRTAMSNQNKENVKSAIKFSPLSSTSLHNLTTSPILNMPVNKRRRQPSKDSPSNPKRRRVSKKLYD